MVRLDRRVKKLTPFVEELLGNPNLKSTESMERKPQGPTGNNLRGRKKPSISTHNSRDFPFSPLAASRRDKERAFSEPGFFPRPEHDRARARSVKSSRRWEKTWMACNDRERERGIDNKTDFQLANKFRSPSPREIRARAYTQAWILNERIDVRKR